VRAPPGNQRARILAADRQALDDPQDDQRDRGGDPDRLMRGQERDQHRRQRHREHGQRQRVLAPDQIGDPSEYQAAERPHQEAGGERAERGDQRDRRAVGRKELLPDDAGEIPVDRKVVPFRDVADEAGNDDASAGRRLGILDHQRCSLHGRRLRVEAFLPEFA
jgi:hypothetical protein